MKYMLVLKYWYRLYCRIGMKWLFVWESLIDEVRKKIMLFNDHRKIGPYFLVPYRYFFLLIYGNLLCKIFLTHGPGKRVDEYQLLKWYNESDEILKIFISFFLSEIMLLLFL